MGKLLHYCKGKNIDATPGQKYQNKIADVQMETMKNKKDKNDKLVQIRSNTQRCILAWTR